MIDEHRFERAWRAHGASILRYCRFTVRSAEAGEDLAAETFARLLQRGDSVTDDRVEAWLFTVARNLCRSHHRRESRWTLLLPRIAALPTHAEAAGRGSDAIALLMALSETDRLAVYLRVVEDRPFAEVARVVGVSEDAAKKKVYRALKRLRRAMPPRPRIRTSECTGGVTDA